MTGVQDLDYSIQRLSADNLDIVATFEIEITRLSFPDDPIEDPAFHIKKLAKSVDQDGALVARTVTTGEIAGWLLASTRKNFATGELYAELRSIYVVPDHRGGALAGLLMQELLDFAARAGAVKLQGRTGAANATMRRLFSKTGFAEKHIVFELSPDEI